MTGREHRGWYKSGKLPHYDEGGLYQSITYRLDDSVPQAMLHKLERELRALNSPENVTEMERRKRIEGWLDAGYGSCILRQSENARLVLDSWRHFDGQRYQLLAGVVMPNHVHLLLRMYEGYPLGELVESWKSFTSRRFVVDEALAYRPHWQRGYWDRFIRNEAHLCDVLRYIAYNPVKAGLVERVGEWAFFVGLETDTPGVDLEVDTPADSPGVGLETDSPADSPTDTPGDASAEASGDRE